MNPARQKVEREMQKTERKVIQITASLMSQGMHVVYALCDDGSMWKRVTDSDNESEWQRIEDIPQT
jgi:hypothetical protein